MIRRPPRSTQSRSSAASDVYKRQQEDKLLGACRLQQLCSSLVLAVLSTHPNQSSFTLGGSVPTPSRRTVGISGNPLGVLTRFSSNDACTQRGHCLRLLLGGRGCRGVFGAMEVVVGRCCLLYTSPSPRDRTRSRMPSSA
eukprot:TRINITY_DN15711_c0_g1_i1.p1 TRINITY_DN15711_c0_g1~~TRINITY_DN15711_c0_g1_i1.p1  ORF type:complete len:140 (+),score=57.98 TRINITY_DN15711_c0_g1_i1:104-523(+)